MIKVAINGFGRIGRLAFRKLLDEENIKVVAINDLSSINMLSHLLKYDSSQGILDKEVKFDEDSIIVDGEKTRVFSEQDPINLPWKELGIDIVLECTGVYKTKEGAMKHIDAGAKKVVISCPSDKDVITIVYNVNQDKYNDEDIISAASCTTNALAPVAKVLEDEYGINIGYMNTVHAYTNDQNLLDLSHKKGDLRRARAAANNIVPSSTGAAKALSNVIPSLEGKLDGCAVRVPVITGSLMELTCELNKKVTVEEINSLFKSKENETMCYNEDEIVSSDIIGSNFGSIFDATLTKVIDSNDKQLVKVSAWYDNEMGYTAQMIRLVKYIGERL